MLITGFLAALFLMQVGVISRLQEDDQGLAPVAVSENGKYLVDAEGNPFFWMGDTGWDLTHRLTKEEIGVLRGIASNPNLVLSLLTTHLDQRIFELRRWMMDRWPGSISLRNRKLWLF
jgi:hypothetical protein